MGRIKYSDVGQTITDKLFLIQYEDGEGVHYIYSPQLDLHGYGYNEKEARGHFDAALRDFIEYTKEYDTLDKVLNNLGLIRIKASPTKAAFDFV